MRKSLFWLVLTLTLAAPARAATLVIDSPKVELEIPAGDTHSGEITVENPTDQPAVMKAYLEDWAYTEAGKGDKEFGPAGTFPYTAAPWITFVAPDPEVPAFGRSVVRYTVKVPEESSGGRYAVLFFETVIGQMPNEEGVVVDVAGRIGTLFFIEVKGASRRAGEIESLSVLPPQGNKPMELETVFKNTGDTAIIVEGNFLIMDAEGQVKGRGDLEKLYTFPGHRSTGITKWVGRLAPGQYTVLATYALGKGQSLVEEKSFSIG